MMQIVTLIIRYKIRIATANKQLQIQMKPLPEDKTSGKFLCHVLVLVHWLYSKPVRHQDTLMKQLTRVAHVL